ncbi:MAG: YbjN domain-containing protein [Micropepsaceae bacterium]
MSPPPAHPGGGLTLGEVRGRKVTMSTVQFETTTSSDNPLDLVEQLASQNEWNFDRAGEDEMHISFPGQSEDHHLAFSWRGNVETLQLSAQLEVKVPKAKRPEIATLINMINEQLWLGHFEMWPDSGQITYRHGLLLRNAMGTPEQCEGMIDAALEACDRYYSAFQFVIWAGKSAAEAAAAVVYQCQGSA